MAIRRFLEHLHTAKVSDAKSKKTMAAPTAVKTRASTWRGSTTPFSNGATGFGASMADQGTKLKTISVQVLI